MTSHSASEVYTPSDPEFAERVRESFGRQTLMETLGVRIESIAPGRVEMSMPYDRRFTQQHGFTHAGITSAVLDSACGYAAFSLMPAEAGILTVEFKINLLAPAKGERFRYVGRVVKPGRTITAVEGTAYGCLADQTEKRIATMASTMMAVYGRDDIAR